MPRRKEGKGKAGGRESRHKSGVKVVRHGSHDTSPRVREGRAASAVARKAAAPKSATRTSPTRPKAEARSGTRRAKDPSARDSGSVRQALWVESPDQRADRSGQTLATRNHEVIRRWAEEHGAVPATVPGTERDGRPGVLRFDFPDYGGGRQLRPVDWDEWFETFDERRLVFRFQEQMTRRQGRLLRLGSPVRDDG